MENSRQNTRFHWRNAKRLEKISENINYNEETNTTEIGGNLEVDGNVKVNSVENLTDMEGNPLSFGGGITNILVNKVGATIEDLYDLFVEDFNGICNISYIDEIFPGGPTTTKTLFRNALMTLKDEGSSYLLNVISTENTDSFIYSGTISKDTLLSSIKLVGINSMSNLDTSKTYTIKLTYNYGRFYITYVED